MLKKKSNSLDKKTSDKKKTVWRLVGSFIVAIALFGVLIGVERNLLSDLEKTEVVLSRTEIPKGTRITDKNVGQLFYLYEVDVKLVDKNCITDLNELINTISSRSLEPQEIVRRGDCMEEASIYTKYQNPAEGSFTVDSAGDIVSGTIRSGDYVDIAVINKDTLDYDLLLKNVYVLDAFTATGETISESTDNVAATMLTIVEEKSNLAKFYSAREIGTVIVTKVEWEN